MAFYLVGARLTFAILLHGLKNALNPILINFLIFTVHKYGISSPYFSLKNERKNPGYEPRLPILTVHSFLRAYFSFNSGLALGLDLLLFIVVFLFNGGSSD